MNRRQKLIQQQFLNNEKAIIKRLDQVYGQALKDVNGKIERLMKRFDPDTGDLMQSAVYQIKYQNMIKDQLEGILQQLHTKEFLTVSDYLDVCYEDGFVGSLFDLHGQGVPMAIPLNQEAMVRAVQLDSKISKGLYTRIGEDVDLLKKRITAEVSRSIANGASFVQTAVQLRDKTRIGYNNAIRIARTEGHRIQCSASQDAAERVKDRGADIVKKWDATLDGKTRESHVAMDGQVCEVEERFSNGLMYPGDPAGAAAEVINCRCAYLQDARKWLEGSFTKWNNFTGQLESFDSPEDYEEFKKGFFSPENKKYMNYVQQMEDKYKTKDFRKVLDQMSDREYKQYSKLLANNPMYNTKASTAGDPIHSTLLSYQAESKKLRTRYAELDANINRYYWDTDERKAHGVERSEQREWKNNFDLASAEQEWIALKPQIEELDDIEGVLQYIDSKQRKVFGQARREYRLDSYGFGDGTATGVHKTTSAKVYTTSDGTEFIYPERYNRKNQTLTPEQAISGWERVPESIRLRAQQQVEVLDYANPRDDYWRSVYGNFPASYMTGGDRISIYKYTRPHDMDYMVDSFAHESAHGMDRLPDGRRFSETSTWNRAMRKDYDVSGKKSPTSYGENANVEDFAESVSMYAKDPEAFERDFPERARIIKTILGE